jgi:uncharacterized phage protein (TIGR02218 family)
MTQLRRNIPSDLRALLDAGRQLLVADLYLIQTADAARSWLWTDLDSPVFAGGVNYDLGLGIKRTKLHRSVGAQGSQLTITLFDRAQQPVLVNGSPMVPWILKGGLDGAKVVLYQAFSAGPGQPWATPLHQHEGQVSDVQTSGRDGVQIIVRSLTEAFNRPLPPTVYQPRCRTTIYSDLCGLLKSAYTVTGTATSATSAGRTTFSTGLSAADGGYDLGVLTFTSGQCNGVSRTVRRQAGGQIVLMSPLPAPVAAGDSYSLYPGCNLTLERCDEFGNRARFRGMPYIPPPESVT